MASAIRPAIAVAAIAARTDADLEPVARSLVSLHLSAPELPIVVAGGADSDPGLLDQVGAAAEELGGELVRSPGSVVAAVNAGLVAARDAGVDAVLVTDHVAFEHPGWLAGLRAREDSAGRPAAIVGARLVHDAGIVASAGLFFSQLSREWLPRLRYAPADLPAALAPCLCPVSGLMLIRAETLATVGLLDLQLSIEHAQLDLCLRAFAAGLECVYEPAAVAVATAPPLPAGSVEPTEDDLRSRRELRTKHRGVDFALWTPEAL